MLVILTAAIAFFTAGCMEQTKPIRSAPPASVVAPDLNRPSKLALIHPNGSLKVGDKVEDADRIFTKPISAYNFNDLPRGFQTPYRARGWEGDGEGFGTILYQNDIALAVWTDSMGRDELDEAIKQYTTVFGKPKKELIGARTSYWIWEEANQRLLINALPSKEKGQYRVTLALGDRAAMDAIRASIPAAQADLADYEKGVKSVRNPG